MPIAIANAGSHRARSEIRHFPSPASAAGRRRDPAPRSEVSRARARRAVALTALALSSWPSVSEVSDAPGNTGGRAIRPRPSRRKHSQHLNQRERFLASPPTSLPVRIGLSSRAWRPLERQPEHALRRTSPAARRFRRGFRLAPYASLPANRYSWRSTVPATKPIARATAAGFAARHLDPMLSQAVMTRSLRYHGGEESDRSGSYSRGLGINTQINGVDLLSSFRRRLQENERLNRAAVF
jgi:hypothetical protein